MVSDYLFPAVVILLKFVYKLAIGRSVSGVDFFRALLNFPIDLAFLALSFAAVILSYFQTVWIHPLSMKDSLTVFLAYVALSALVTFFVRNSENNFDIDRNGELHPVPKTPS
jgi:hypothetical protein